MPKTGEIGSWKKKADALKYAKRKNARARKYKYTVKRPSFFRRPGFKGVKAGWTVLVTRK